MLKETEQQDTTMLRQSQVQVHVNKDRAGVWRLKESCVRATRTTGLSMRSESWRENASDLEWPSTSIIHDLRNPLGAIYTATETLMDIDPGPTQVKRLAINICRAAGRTRELLADVNSVTGGNRPTAEMCDISEVIAAESDAVSVQIRDALRG